MTENPVIDTYWIPRWILDRSWTILRQDGLKGVESTVLWGGRRFGREAIVVSILYPCGQDVALSRGLIRVGSDTTAEMGRTLRSQGLTGLIQIHTHPGKWTGHSDTDNDFSIASSNGFVSLVWPEFAKYPIREPSDFGIHRLLNGRWETIDPSRTPPILRFVESEVFVWAHQPEPVTKKINPSRRLSDTVERKKR